MACMKYSRPLKGLYQVRAGSRRSLVSGIQISLHLVRKNSPQNHSSFKHSLGSWEGCIRLWRLHLPNRSPREDSTSKPAGFSLSLIGELAAPGFVNSLQFINLPRSTEAPEWTRRRREEVDERPEQESPARPAATARGTVLLTAALGQEPRLGRWMRLSGEDGAQNVARVYALL